MEGLSGRELEDRQSSLPPHADTACQAGGGSWRRMREHPATHSSPPSVTPAEARPDRETEATELLDPPHPLLHDEAVASW